MTIKRATLLGFQSPTGQKLGFQIPIFESAQSNALLVQVTNKFDIIIDFTPFYTEIDFVLTDLKVEKQVGERALWCFEVPHSDPLLGDLRNIAKQFEVFRQNDFLLQAYPYVALQIISACGLQKRYSQIFYHVYRQTASDMGVPVANSWAETVITQAARESLTNIMKGLNSRRHLRDSFNDIQVICNEVASVCIPILLYRYLEKQPNLVRLWIDLIQKSADIFEMYVTRDLVALVNFTKTEAKRKTNTNKENIKTRIVSWFSSEHAVNLQRNTKSYFSTDDGRCRVVCTLSSRYEDKGKRKYWYGFHRTWNEWLRNAPQAYVLLGCIDSNDYYSFPLSFFAERLSLFRSSGEGKDKYWHIDLVEIDQSELLIDLPGERRAQNIDEFRRRYT